MNILLDQTLFFLSYSPTCLMNSVDFEKKTVHGGLNPHNSETAGYIDREWSILDSGR